MAEADSNPQQPRLVKIHEEQRLKYLDFVQVAAFYATMYAAKLYSYAKENSGPLKHGVDTVEGNVKTVVGPVYDKYHGVPVDVLKFVDRKVDESMSKLQSHVPVAACSVMSEVKNAGIVGTAKSIYAKCEPAAKDLYLKYELVAEQYAASAWRSLNQLTLFPRVARAVGPTVGYYSDKYNQTVEHAAEKGYTIASYLPLVPIERVAKVLSS